MRQETFFEKFDTFADAPDAVTKMRELVLRLAFSGGLSGKNTTDASPPSGWEQRTIESICSLLTPGFACSRSHQVEDGHVHLRTHNISTLGTLNFDLTVRIDPKMVDPMKSSLGMGDILFNNTNSQELVGKSALVDRDYDYGFSNHITRLRLKEDVYPGFVVYYLTLLRNSGYFAKLCTRWINQAAVNTETLKAQSIPLPPLAEQKRIVAKVNELMALCDRLEAQQQERETRHAALTRASLARFADAPTPANLDLLFHKSYSIPPADLRKSILALAVQGKLVPQGPNDEPAEELLARIEDTKRKLIKQRTLKRVSVAATPNDDAVESLPPGWLWTRLGSAFDVRDGTHDTPKYTTAGYPLITSKNIYSGKLLFDGANLISEKDHGQISERSRVDEGDILFAMIGSIGNPVIVDTDREFSIKNVALFKYYSAADSEPRFLLQYLKLVSGEMKAKAAGGVQSFVSLGYLRNYPFPLPPLGMV